MDIVTLTMNPSVDVFTSTETITPEHKLRCSTPRRDPGGGGINAARAIRTLGGEALALFPAGGPIGQHLEKLLIGEGVLFRSLEMAGQTRESFTVLENNGGREYRFVLAGPDMRESEWENCLDALEKSVPAPGFVIASGSLPPGVPEDFYARLARWAKGRDIKMVLDTSGPPLRVALEEGVFLAKPNRREMELMCDRPMDDEKAQEELSRQLIAEGKCRILALTLGASGALLTTPKQQCRVRPPTVEVRSSVGAGDSFVGALVYGLQRGMVAKQAFCFAVAAGTAALLTPGTELCRRDDTEELFRSICEGEK